MGHKHNLVKESVKSNVEVTFLPLRPKTGASGVYNCQECSLISPSWSGSTGISGVGLLAAAAAFDEAVLLFVGWVGRIHSVGINKDNLVICHTVLYDFNEGFDNIGVVAVRAIFC